MDTDQIIVITLLSVVGVVALLSLLYRMADMRDNLWVEPTVIVITVLFIYLVAR